MDRDSEDFIPDKYRQLAAKETLVECDSNICNSLFINRQMRLKDLSSTIGRKAAGLKRHKSPPEN